jgi:hypothetical protein
MDLACVKVFYYAARVWKYSSIAAQQVAYAPKRKTSVRKAWSKVSPTIFRSCLGHQDGMDQ